MGTVPIFLSAGLLVLAFPSFNQPWCAWVALVPWLLALRTLRGRAAFDWSWLVGFLFFLGSLWWLAHLTRFGGPAAILGWLALSAYLGLSFGAFGWFVRWAQQRSDQRPETRDQRPAHQGIGSHVSGLMSQVWRLVFIPSVWVALEFARSQLLSGFGWNLLAYSQTPWLPVIQVADLTGAWGVSWLIVFVNTAIADALSRRTGRLAPLATAAGVIALALGYGLWRLPQVDRPSDGMRLAVVQGNIPQESKWDEAFQDSILERYEMLTRQAARARPDMIVWPETAAPGYLNLEEPVLQRVTALAREVRVPLLVGAPMSQLEGLAWRTTNSAVLIGTDGAFGARYDKLHLVPFGEFVPGERRLPWLRRLLPLVGAFDPGLGYTVFRDGTIPFSVLICFEDVFPELARRFVREGARLLLVITNDAWFGPTGAAYQHAQASTFRAVELRVPVVRAANTGWSGCIEPSGRWTSRVRDPSGRELFVAGTAACEPSAAAAATAYLRWGDWFAWLCTAVSLLALGAARAKA